MMAVQASALSYLATHGASAFSKKLLAKQKLSLLAIPHSKALKARSIVKVEALQSDDKNSWENEVVNEQKRGLFKGLLGAVGVVRLPALVAQSAKADDEQGGALSQMSYSRFLEYLEMDRRLAPMCNGKVHPKP